MRSIRVIMFGGKDCIHMCQRVSNTVNTVLYCNYRCVVDLVTSRGKKNNANIPKLHITKLLIDISQQDLTYILLRSSKTDHLLNVLITLAPVRSVGGHSYTSPYTSP